MKKMKDAMEAQKSFKCDQEGDLKERENEMQHKPKASEPCKNALCCF